MIAKLGAAALIIAAIIYTYTRLHAPHVVDDPDADTDTNPDYEPHPYVDDAHYFNAYHANASGSIDT